MKPGDREVIAFVKPLAVGDEFTDWPLHITIIPWFRTEVSSEALAAEFTTKLTGIKPFRVRIGKEAHFGARKKLVSLIKQPTPLVVIETRSRQVLKAHNAWIVDESTKKQRPYRPHITAQPEGRVYEGDEIAVDSLYIVSQQGDYKLVESEVKLDG